MFCTAWCYCLPGKYSNVWLIIKIGAEIVFLLTKTYLMRIITKNNHSKYRIKTFLLVFLINYQPPPPSRWWCETYFKYKNKYNSLRTTIIKLSCTIIIKQQRLYNYLCIGKRLANIFLFWNKLNLYNPLLVAWLIRINFRFLISLTCLYLRSY